jgi:RNA:NAD 2'-phosphotransferase (TPT1/KptA family)
MSIDQETALLIAKRKQGISFIIRVQASKAYQNGIKFYQGNNTTWLASIHENSSLQVGILAVLQGILD